LKKVTIEKQMLAGLVNKWISHFLRDSRDKYSKLPMCLYEKNHFQWKKWLYPISFLHLPFCVSGCMVQYPDTCYFVSGYKLHTTFIIFLFIIIIYEKLITIYLNII